jgi:porin
MKMTSPALLIVMLLFGASAHAAQAQTDPSAEEATASATAASSDSLWTRDKLTGDWGGSRTKLTDKGVDLEFRLSQYQQWVAGGGINQNGEYGGTMDYRLNIDADKLFGAKGLSFNMHARTRFGNDVNADAGSFALQNAGMLSPSPGDYHGTDITGLTVSKFFPLFGQLAQGTLGKLNAIDLVTGFFPSIAYGQEGFWNANSMVSALPWFGAVAGLSLYGGMVVTIDQELGLPKSGFLFTGTTNVATNWGSISDAFDDGVWLAGFHRFYWKKDEKLGYFMIFGGYSTKGQSSNDPNDWVNIPGQGIESTETKNPWDIALYLYQDFWQAEGNPERKANFMIGGTIGPDNPQFAQWNFFANVEVVGLKESRPYDKMGVAYWWNGLSPNFKQLVSPEIDLRNTWGLEIYYNYAITPWLHLSPDLQLVKNEREGDNLAVIPGIRLVIDF